MNCEVKSLELDLLLVSLVSFKKMAMIGRYRFLLLLHFDIDSHDVAIVVIDDEELVGTVAVAGKVPEGIVDEQRLSMEMRSVPLLTQQNCLPVLDPEELHHDLFLSRERKCIQGKPAYEAVLLLFVEHLCVENLVLAEPLLVSDFDNLTQIGNEVDLHSIRSI